MPTDQYKLQQIIDFSLEITQIQNVDVLLEKILSAARKLVSADAGTIYIKDGNTLKFSHTQNDTLQKRLPPGEKLIYRTFSVPISHNSISGYVASTGEIINIPDVYQLNTDQVPYAFDRSYDEKTHYLTQSMLTIPLKNNRNAVIGVMQLINAQNRKDEVVPFFKYDIPLIRIFANNAAMAIERAQLTRAKILGMIRILTELRDPEETEAHVNRVGAYSAEIYEAWVHKKGVSQAEIDTDTEMLRMAAMLHDIGKLAIPHNIRKKPGKLTAEEYKIIKQHTVKGAQMLLRSSQSEYEEVAVQIALNHHERWDGRGYPGYTNLLNSQVIPGYEDEQGRARGKRGEEIPVFGRVVAIADVYDSLSCCRVYRKALKEAKVLEILKKGAGKSFEPVMIDAFFSKFDTIRTIGQQFPEEE